MAGRAIGGTSSPGLRERAGATAGARAAPPQRSPGGPVTRIAAEVRELHQLADQIALRLAELDSGILTDEESSEQKRRLLGR
jgi:hypothetical protein